MCVQEPDLRNNWFEINIKATQQASPSHRENLILFLFHWSVSSISSQSVQTHTKKSAWAFHIWKPFPFTWPCSNQQAPLLRHRVFTRSGQWILSCQLISLNEYTLVKRKCAPIRLEVSRRVVLSCKQALNLCLEQGCLNTNNFSLQKETQLRWKLSTSLKRRRYHCGTAVRPGGIDTAVSLKTGAALSGEPLA